jgi:hypothetical protein
MQASTCTSSVGVADVLQLFLFYETPTAADARHAVSRVCAALRANGFAEPQVVRFTNLVGCYARLA